MAEALARKSNIILVGFMGSGKTVIGRHVARLLEYSFADTDEAIREVTGMELSRLFHKYGEIRFRSEEKLVIHKLAGNRQQVIACGGSLVPARESLEMLADYGFFVLLTAAPEVIQSRISRKNDRLLPLGKPSEETIKEMLKEREDCFADFPHINVDTGKMGVEEAAEFIAAAYRNYQRDH
jgi:shikimate kinase